jgi:hypothetical protein
MEGPFLLEVNARLERQSVEVEDATAYIPAINFVKVKCLSTIPTLDGSESQFPARPCYPPRIQRPTDDN